MTDQDRDNAPTDLPAPHPDWLVVGAKIEVEDQQWSLGAAVVKPRGSLELLDCALIEWDRTGGQQWIEHNYLRLPRGSNASTYEWYRNAVERQIADPRDYLPRDSLLEAEQAAWIRAFGSSALRQQLQQGMDYRIAGNLWSEWVELHRKELGTKQGEISKHRLPGFTSPHSFIVVADAARPGHVKVSDCGDANIDLFFLIKRASFYNEPSADGYSLPSLRVQPTAFLGVREGGAWINRHADFVVCDPKNPARGEWVSSVPIQGYASAADEAKAVAEFSQLAMRPCDAKVLRDRIALRVAFDKLTADVKARHGGEVRRLLRVAEAACQQTEPVHERHNTRARGR